MTTIRSYDPDDTPDEDDHPIAYIDDEDDWGYPDTGHSHHDTREEDRGRR